MLHDARKISLFVYIPVKRVIYTPHAIKPSEVMSCLPGGPGAGLAGAVPAAELRGDRLAAGVCVQRCRGDQLGVSEAEEP